MATDSGDDVGVKDDARVDPMDTRATADDSQASDNDNAERPVRHKLKETSITSAPNASTTGASTEQQQDGENSRSSSRGRKRSFDEDQPENLDEENGHRRKRSRDSKAEEDENITSLNAPEAEGEQTQTTNIARKILSPKKKRSRDQLDKDEPKAESTVEDNKTSAENGASTTTAGEPEKKRHRDASQERGSAPLKSAFANTSAVSPFGSLGASKPKEETSKPVATSSSAFAASSLAAFASSEQSPFGAIGGSNTSVFKSATTTEATKPAATGFAGAASTSGFASLGSGFSGFSGGFGAAGLKGGLTSFAAPGGAGILGSSSKSKPFGAEEDEEEEEKEKEKEADTAPGEFEEDKTDERFFERPKDKKAARLIMRADGVLRVMLNTPLFKGMKVGDASGNEPKSKQIHLASLEEGRSVPTLLRGSVLRGQLPGYQCFGTWLSHIRALRFKR
ncbi:unnamed protein product [Aspergillus oryzae RIB40]|uniref:DNA, SC011 n=1 Tax=Aspergillus oryzae (strain ATCC 42149 / RIB 40) TaxID=510516 RepID=Q2U082_ASPOR|nr:unnamed protein product [Aspergillus oryzae RIB40]BAE65033.1 unnamed protein product [Aspergillus oryzae RIB40]